MTYITLKPNGEIDGALVSKEALDEALFKKITNDISIEEIFSNYVWDFELNLLTRVDKKPSSSHTWSSFEKKWVYDISKLKDEVSRGIDKKCRDSISAGYVSEIDLNYRFKYPYGEKDQMNMLISVTDSVNPQNGDDWFTLFWCADPDGNWDYRPHTKKQIQKASADGKSHLLSCLSKNARLQARIQAATTEDELNSIAW